MINTGIILVVLYLAWFFYEVKNADYDPTQYESPENNIQN